jgi:hypothetical protein
MSGPEESESMLSRRTFLQLLEFAAAALAFRPLAAVASSLPTASPADLVIVNGWVLRRDDLAALPRSVTVGR